MSTAASLRPYSCSLRRPSSDRKLVSIAPAHGVNLRGASAINQVSHNEALLRSS